MGREKRRWRQIHTVATILIVVGIATTLMSWYVAIMSGGLLMSWSGVGGGPLAVVYGSSLWLFPRMGDGPDGDEIGVNWLTEVGTIVVGLLLGLADWFALRAALGK